MFEQGDDINLDTDSPPPPEKSNRTFIIAAGIMGGLVLLTIILMALYVTVFLPRTKANQSSVQATILAQNALIAQAMTQTMEANMLGTQAAATMAVPTQTVTPIRASSTPVLAVATQTPLISFANMTATWSALNTQVAVGLRTPTGTPGGSMPASGFAEDFGIPGLVLMTLALVLVILLARRLRSAPVQ
jgi:hypothetical protein